MACSEAPGVVHLVVALVPGLTNCYFATVSAARVGPSQSRTWPRRGSLVSLLPGSVQHVS